MTPDTNDIPYSRVKCWLPRGWIALSPREVETHARLLRNYSQECADENGCGVPAAEAQADKIERRASE